jgi:hypothetical protein
MIPTPQMAAAAILAGLALAACGAQAGTTSSTSSSAPASSGTSSGTAPKLVGCSADGTTQLEADVLFPASMAGTTAEVEVFGQDGARLGWTTVHASAQPDPTSSPPGKVTGSNYFDLWPTTGQSAPNVATGCQITSTGTATTSTPISGQPVLPFGTTAPLGWRA